MSAEWLCGPLPWDWACSGVCSVADVAWSLGEPWRLQGLGVGTRWKVSSPELEPYSHSEVESKAQLSERPCVQFLRIMTEGVWVHSNRQGTTLVQKSPLICPEKSES